MTDLTLVFDFIYHCISDYLLLLNSYWLTQIFLYILVTGFVVSTILLLRGK